jgi:hypothetical protein
MWRQKMNRRFLSGSRRGRRTAVGPEVGAGIYVNRLPAGSRLLVQTSNRRYLIETLGGCNVLIGGHPLHCPEPIRAAVHGSIRNASKIEPLFIGCGMRLEVWKVTGGIMRTSRIRKVRVVDDCAMPPQQPPPGPAHV